MSRLNSLPRLLLQTCRGRVNLDSCVLSVLPLGGKCWIKRASRCPDQLWGHASANRLQIRLGFAAQQFSGHASSLYDFTVQAADGLRIGIGVMDAAGNQQTVAATVPAESTAEVVGLPAAADVAGGQVSVSASVPAVGETALLQTATVTADAAGM